MSESCHFRFVKRLDQYNITRLKTLCSCVKEETFVETLIKVNHFELVVFNSLSMAEVKKTPVGVNNGTGTESTARVGEDVSRGNVSNVGVTTNSLTSNHPGPPVDISPPKLKSILPLTSSSCVYTSYYCEENVWKLCESIRGNYPSEIDFCHVAFISNPKRTVPMWRQKAGSTDDKLALWDYHVILFYNPDERCVVYDMDSDLPFPTYFHKYVTETFRTENILDAEYHRFFRVLPASKFLSLFSSDRRHMKRDDGSWTKTPPAYPPIVSAEEHNLERFLDMTTPKSEYGELFNLMELVRRFYKPRQLS